MITIQKMMVLASTMRMRKVDNQMSKMSISGNSHWTETGGAEEAS
ncbi:MAG: hypothetical protein ACJ70Z_00840 [Nitrososphaera sp.]